MEPCSRPAPDVPPRPLKREGARYFLSPAEQKMHDAINRPRPISKSVLGKRARQSDQPQDGDDTDKDEEPFPAVSQPQSGISSISKVTAAVLRYANKKRLRTEQRHEVEAFLLDTPLGRQAKLFTCLLSVETKVDALLSANPPFQLSEDSLENVLDVDGATYSAGDDYEIGYTVADGI